MTGSIKLDCAINALRLGSLRGAPRLADGTLKVLRKSRGRVAAATLSPALVMLAACETSNVPQPEGDTAHIQGDVIRYGQWALGCSNQRVCTAVAPLHNDQSGDAPPSHMRVIFQVDIADPQSITVVRDGEQLDALSPLAMHQLSKELQKNMPSDAIYTTDKSVRYSVPRDGFTKVMNVLARWRALPPQQLASTDVITPFPALHIDDPGIPPLVVNAAKRCPKGHMGQSLQAWRSAGGALLWRTGCGNEGLNSVSFWFTSGPDDFRPDPVTFEDGGQSVTPYNSWFQDSSGYLRTTQYFGSNEDCGVYRAFAWNEDGMKLAEKRSMPICGTGIGPKDWITTDRAVIFNGTDPVP